MLGLNAFIPLHTLEDVQEKVHQAARLCKAIATKLNALAGRDRGKDYGVDQFDLHDEIARLPFQYNAPQRRR